MTGRILLFVHLNYKKDITITNIISKKIFVSRDTVGVILYRDVIPNPRCVIRRPRPTAPG
jgi:hypothetical protein